MMLSKSTKIALAVIVLLLAVVASSDILTMWNIRKAGANETPPLWDQLNARTDELGFDSFLATSTLEAETFRRSLLVGDDDGQTKAELIGLACSRFQKFVNSELPADGAGLPLNLSHFELSSDEITEAIKGARKIPDPQTFYGSFAGKWYGLWEQNEVDHFWGDYVALERPKSFSLSNHSNGEPNNISNADLDPDPVNLLGYQYAWVGDGYGINHVASSDDGKENFLLGYVVHVKDMDLEQEVGRRPHVGVIDGTKRLIWITKGEVFFEESIGRGTKPEGKTADKDRYWITGFRYEIKSDENGKRLFAKDGFQAVYAREHFSPPRNQRMVWRGFEFEIEIGSK